MKKLTFGTPEELVPSTYCDGFNYVETEVKYDISKIKAKENGQIIRQFYIDFIQF